VIFHMQSLMSSLGLLLVVAVRMPTCAADLSHEDFDRLRKQIRETLLVPYLLPVLEPRIHGVFEVDH